NQGDGLGVVELQPPGLAPLGHQGRGKQQQLVFLSRTQFHVSIPLGCIYCLPSTVRRQCPAPQVRQMRGSITGVSVSLGFSSCQAPTKCWRQYSAEGPR